MERQLTTDCTMYVKNSWGPDCGDHGYIRVDWEALQKFKDHDFVVLVRKERAKQKKQKQDAPEAPGGALQSGPRECGASTKLKDQKTSSPVHRNVWMEAPDVN